MPANVGGMSQTQINKNTNLYHRNLTEETLLSNVSTLDLSVGIGEGVKVIPEILENATNAQHILASSLPGRVYTLPEEPELLLDDSVEGNTEM